jgi:hypothetical protein
MPGVVESLATINSLLRTGLAVLGIGLVSAGVYYGYRVYHAGDLALQEKDRQLASIREELLEKDQLLEQRQRQLEVKDEEIAQLQVTVREQDEKIQKLDTALRLLKVNHRVAWLTVLEQEVDPETNELYTTGQFVEVNDRGEPLGAPREFRVRGDVVYIDNWVVKFEDQYVERAEIDRSTSLVLFRRIFGESQTPNEGIPLDPVGSRPQAYGSAGAISEFEKRIWEDFWTIANDEAKARELGIRAAHGEAPSMKLQKGKSYKIQLRASDGLSITPDAGPPPVVGKPAA